jgi:hypothetical protein
LRHELSKAPSFPALGVESRSIDEVLRFFDHRSLEHSLTFA